MTESVRETEIRIKEMLNERNQISGRNNKGRFRGPPRGGERDGDRFNNFTTPMSGGDKWNHGASGSEPRISLLSAEEKTIEERPDMKTQLDKSTIKRGSRMMGGILGHLKKAKTAEERAKSNPRLVKKLEAEQIVEKKIQNLSDNLREARRLEAMSRKNEDLKRKRELRINIMVEERKLMRLKLEEHYKPMMNYVRTDTGPSLFFMPKNLNPTMEAKIIDTRAKIDNKIQQLRSEFDENTLREELNKQQEEWEVDHPLLDVSIRDKQEMLDERARRKEEREAREAERKPAEEPTKDEDVKGEEKIEVEQD